MSYGTSLGEDSFEACVWFPLDFISCPFPFADYASYPFFPATNHSHQYDYRSSMSLPSKLSNLRGVGTPDKVNLKNLVKEARLFQKQKNAYYAHTHNLLASHPIPQSVPKLFPFQHGHSVHHIFFVGSEVYEKRNRMYTDMYIYFSLLFSTAGECLLCSRRHLISSQLLGRLLIFFRQFSSP